MSGWRRILVLACLVLVWSLRGEAAELKGFGPIEFGMTKAEAKVALGDQAILEEEDHLTYWYEIEGDLPASGADTVLKVFQYFYDGRAADVFLHYEPASTNESPLICAASTDHFVSALTTTYGTYPIIQELEAFHDLRNHKVTGETKIIYKFPLEDSAFIQIENLILPDTGCAISFWYHPPEANPIPF